MSVRLETWFLTGARLCGFALLCLAWASAPAATQAQDDTDAARNASARELFEQGVELAEHGDWPAAEDRYRRALQLRVSSVIAYNLASALSEQGKLIEATEMLRRVLTDDKTEPALRQAATALQAALGPRIGRIQVALQGQAHDDSVRLDGRVLHSAQLNVEIPVDPGSHQLQLERAGKTLDLQTFSLEPGGREEIELVAPALAATPLLTPDIDTTLESPPARSERPADSVSPSLLSRWWFWTGVVAAVGVGTMVGVAASGGGAQPAPAYQGTLGSLKVEVAK